MTSITLFISLILIIFIVKNCYSDKFVVNLSSKTYGDFIKQKGMDILVGFSSSTCTNCPRISGLFNDVGNDPDLQRLALVFVDCAEEKQWCSSIGVNEPYPVLRYIHDGQVFHYYGLLNHEGVRKYLSPYFTAFGYGYEPDKLLPHSHAAPLRDEL